MRGRRSCATSAATCRWCSRTRTRRSTRSATVADIVGEPFQVHFRMGRKERDEKVVALLEQVGMSAAAPPALPVGVLRWTTPAHRRGPGARARTEAHHRRRAGERARHVDPVTGGEPADRPAASASGVALLFIAHDLSIVHHASDRIAVMYLGTIVEVGGAEEVYARPSHPYAEALISAIPVPDPADRAHPHAASCSRVTRPARSTRRRAAATTRGAPTRWRSAPRWIRSRPRRSNGGTVACHLHTSGPVLGGRPLAALDRAGRRDATA